RDLDSKGKLNMTIESCDFINNFAYFGGGAVWNQSLSKFKLLDCKFINNYTEGQSSPAQSSYKESQAGAVLTGDDTEIKNCLFDSNHSVYYGGAIVLRSMNSNYLINTKIINTSILNNSAGWTGGGIFSYYSYDTILTNTILFNNGVEIYVRGTLSDIPDINNCAIEGELNIEYTGENNITLNPNNSGDEFSPYFSDPESGHWWLQSASPLKNAGIWTDDVPLYDLVGNPRDATPDIGCYEYDPTSIEENDSSLPFTTKLYQNYPNPFNPATNIKFDLSKTTKVELSVYNIAGQLVRKLVDKEMPAGYHSVRFEADDLNSGMYFYTLKTSDKKLTRKMLMVK
ncbi:MAG: T9SS type A sorting domain-containing protein, partial [Candidatus Delongbacteria bacterium]|nr:T9SS type A sorting domain-containing protein [Candidatus Delongbacteria bacterium]